MITLTTIVSNKLTNALPLVDESIINEVQQNYLLHLRTGDDYKAALAQSNSAQSNNEPQLKDFESVTHQSTNFIYHNEQTSIDVKASIIHDVKINLLVNNVISKDLASTLASSASSISNAQNSSNWSYLLSVQQKADRRNLWAVTRLYKFRPLLIMRSPVNYVEDHYGQCYFQKPKLGVYPCLLQALWLVQE